MECRLQKSTASPWKCQVLLRFETDIDGHRLASIAETPFGPDIFDPLELEDRLRRAQLAILNPSVSPSDFLNSNFHPILWKGSSPPFGSTRQLEFSSNVVCINVYGQHIPDLSFVDLPGSHAMKTRELFVTR